MEPLTITGKKPTRIWQTTHHRDQDGRMIECDTAEGVTAFFAPVTVTLNTPHGPQPLMVRVEFKLCLTLEDAFDRFDKHVQDNLQPAVHAEMEKIKAQQTRASLANLSGAPIPDLRRK